MLDLRGVAVVVALRVSCEPIRIDAHERRNGLFAHQPHRAAQRLAERLVVPGSTRKRTNAERRCQRADVSGERFALIGGLRVTVVLQQDEQRQTPLRSHIERFVDDAFAERAITDADRHDPTLTGQLLRKSESGADRNDATLDAVAEEASSAQVLTAANTGADTRARSHDLGDQPLDARSRPMRIPPS